MSSNKRERGQNVNPDCVSPETQSVLPVFTGGASSEIVDGAESCHQQCSTPQMFLPNMELKSWLARLEDFLLRATLYTAGTQITGFFAEFHEPSYCRPVTTDSRKVMQLGRKTGIFEDHPLAWLSDGLLTLEEAHRITERAVEADRSMIAWFTIHGPLWENEGERGVEHARYKSTVISVNQKVIDDLMTYYLPPELEAHHLITTAAIFALALSRHVHMNFFEEWIGYTIATHAMGFKQLSVCMDFQRATIGVYCRIAVFYLIYEYLVCDQVDKIMQDAYLQIDFCVDYHRLNAITCVDAQSIPHIDHTLDTLPGRPVVQHTCPCVCALASQKSCRSGHFPAPDGDGAEGINEDGLVKRCYRLWEN
ncbi:hypothetical protein T4D_804 [Trichinella pseudospiralis]|uniref:Uncharacterized protein n=1 Tax=Trichinella pseudospiralis TaxID=6337 RepID=A0A0V1FQJ5_TRIPS|nr:hypothetical protein T4D_804 [Trichinella pseudospiralis]